MLPVHDHYALVSTTNVSASGETMFLCRRAASGSGLSGWLGAPAIFGHKPSQGPLPRLAA